jgi:hypothetical protein
MGMVADGPVLKNSIKERATEVQTRMKQQQKSTQKQKRFVTFTNTRGCNNGEELLIPMVEHERRSEMNDCNFLTGPISAPKECEMTVEILQGKLENMTVDEIDKHSAYHGEYTEDMYGIVLTAINEVYSTTAKAMDSKWGKLFEGCNTAEINQMLANGTVQRVLNKDVPSQHKKIQA